jgi:hypothetical protein
MSQLQSDTAITYANQTMNLVQQLRILRVSVAELMTINANNPLGNLWNPLKTTGTNADGTLGTADGTPVVTNPIDSRIYPALSREASATAIEAALQILVDFNTFLNGTALSANAARPAQINAVSM